MIAGKSTVGHGNEKAKEREWSAGWNRHSTRGQAKRKVFPLRNTLPCIANAGKEVLIELLLISNTKGLCLDGNKTSCSDL